MILIDDARWLAIGIGGMTLFAFFAAFFPDERGPKCERTKIRLELSQDFGLAVITFAAVLLIAIVAVRDALSRGF